MIASIRRHPDLDAHGRDEFQQMTEDYWVAGSGAGTALGFSALLGLVVGAVIVGQTLYAVTKEHLRELATLKAIGATPFEIVSFVTWQAAVLAFVGGGLGFLFSYLLAGSTIGMGLFIVLSPTVLAIGAAAVLVHVRGRRALEHPRGAHPAGRRGVQVRRSVLLVNAVEVEKTYGSGELAVPVLKGVSLEVRAGELVLFMGPSGSGKTTLISVLAGLMRPSGGRVDLCGPTISELTEVQIAAVRRKHLGFVFQSYNLVSRRSPRWTTSPRCCA